MADNLKAVHTTTTAEEKTHGTPGLPGAVVVAEDPTAPSKDVTSKRQKLSDIFTIFAAGFALISDGYFNNLMTMVNVVLKKEYPKDYTPAVSTQVSNALVSLSRSYQGSTTLMILQSM
jgi:hypothetical protein